MSGTHAMMTVGSRREAISVARGLSPARRRVFVEILRGRSVEGIAEQLQIAIGTARNHVKAVLDAFEAPTRLELIALFVTIPRGFD